MAEIFSHTACRQVSRLLLSIAIFNWSEYVLAIAIHGRTNVTLKSLLISRNYLLAMIISLVEYFIEISLYLASKQNMGEIIRQMAIITAGRPLTHLIKIYHEEHYELVTLGIFAYIQHPSYCGVFIWSVGTQIMLCNPASITGFRSLFGSSSKIEYLTRSYF